eukprot:Pgem_evm1s16581
MCANTGTFSIILHRKHHRSQHNIAEEKQIILADTKFMSLVFRHYAATKKRSQKYQMVYNIWNKNSKKLNSHL